MKEGKPNKQSTRRLIKPDEIAKMANSSDTDPSLRNLLSQLQGEQAGSEAAEQGVESKAAQEQQAESEASKEAQALRVLFAGNIDIIETLLRSDSAFRGDAVQSVNSEGIETFVQRVGMRINLHAPKYYDSVVFCAYMGAVETVEAFCKKGYNFGNGFEPPIILVGKYSFESMIGKPNRWVIDTRGKDPGQLRETLKKMIAVGKDFVHDITNSALLMMLNEPEIYSGLQKKKSGRVRILEPTSEGYEKGKELLESRDPNEPRIGAFAVDDLDPWQQRLLDKVENEYSNIPTAYVGSRLHPELKGYKCTILSGFEVANRGIMRIVEDFNPARIEDLSEGSLTQGSTTFHYDGSGRISRITAKFEAEPEAPAEPEIPIKQPPKTPAKHTPRRAEFDYKPLSDKEQHLAVD